VLGQCECTSVVLTLRVFLSGGLAPQEVPTDWAGQRPNSTSSYWRESCDIPIMTPSYSGSACNSSLAIFRVSVVDFYPRRPGSLPGECQRVRFLSEFFGFPMSASLRQYSIVIRISPRRCRVGPSETAVLHWFSIFLTQENKKAPLLNLGPKLATMIFSSHFSPLFPDIV